jgi:hypothetical protein
MLIGLCVYFLYARSRSNLCEPSLTAAEPQPTE